MKFQKTALLFLSIFLPVANLVYAEAEKAPAPEKKYKIFISVDSIIDSSKDWSKDTCQKIHAIASKFATVDAKCIRLDSLENFIGDPIGDAEKSKEYAFHMQLRESSNKNYRFFIENWLPADATEPKKMEWKLNLKNPRAWETEITPLIGNLLSFANNRGEVKQFFLAQGINDSKKLKVDDQGRIIEVATGKELTGQEAYTTFANEGERQKNFLRAGLEIGAVIGFSSIHYYMQLRDGPNPNNGDWEYWGAAGQKAKYSNRFAGIRMDDNSYDINRGHALAGMIYYQIARNNGLSSAESFLYTFAASSTWEMTTEHREVLSINDEIFTPVGGFVIGEVFHQMSQLILTRTNTLPGKILATIFDVPGAYERWQGQNISGYRSVVGTGFDQEKLSHFDFFTGVKAGSYPNDKTANGLTFGVHGEVMSIPLYEEPGSVSKLYTDSVFTELLISGTTKEMAFDSFSTLAKVVFAAYHNKNITLDEEGRKNGYTMYFGASSAVEYDDTRSRSAMTEDPDINATVHVIGNSMDLSAFVKGVRVRAKIDVFGDFAMLDSYALDLYKKSNSVNGTVATIANHGYYYGYGITARSNLSVQWNNIEAGYALSKQALDSINSRNRNQAVVTKNLNYADDTIKQEIYVTYDINKSLKMKFAVERIDRSGNIDGAYNKSTTETRTTGTLIYSF